MNGRKGDLAMNVVYRIIAGTLCAGCIGCAHVQTTQSWSDLRHALSIGTPVAVATVGQPEIRGKVSAVSSDALTVVINRMPHKFNASEVRQVRRDGDSLWNGLAIGAGIGVLGALLPDNRCTGQPPRCDDRQIAQRATFLAAATAAGIGIDALHRDRTVLYRSRSRVRVRLVPMLTPGRTSISIAISTRR